jgi:hypothetical protein
MLYRIDSRAMADASPRRQGWGIGEEREPDLKQRDQGFIVCAHRQRGGVDRAKCLIHLGKRVL